jgi:glycine cleavage system H protein
MNYMEQFVYSDIFDTKGIEYIIVILFFMLLIPFWRVLNRPVKLNEVMGDAIHSISLQALRIPRGLLFDKNHTWSHLERSGVASVGMDDLLLHLTGGVELNYLKEQQERVKRGEPIARITQKGKELLITSPISGRIERVHSALEEGSGAIMEDPYNSWLYRIRPENWGEETRGAMMADQAYEWTGKELERFRDYLAEVAGEGPGAETMLQEGGELTIYPLREMDQKVWMGFQEKFLALEG